MYDTIIIGGGPGGYLAAERLAKNKKKVLLLEEGHLGGTCLNLGCIPTKTLLNSVKLYHQAQESEKFGITASDIGYDWKKIQDYKNETVKKLRENLTNMLKNSEVEVKRGRGEIVSAPSGDKPAIVKQFSSGSTEAAAEHEAKTVLVCAGSAPVNPPIPGAKDNPLVMDSAWILNIKTVPKRLTIIGGGVIGVEFAGLFSALGTEVTVIEMMEEIIPFMDREQAQMYRRVMKNIKFLLGCRVEKIEGGTVFYTDKNGTAENTEAELILMAVGRRPVLDGWGAAAAGIDTTGTTIGTRKIPGVVTDDRMRTNVPGIWAAGDVTGRSMLAHSAYRMGEVAAADILTVLDGGSSQDNTNNRMRYNAIPWAIYGVTEAAGVGMTEQEAAAMGIDIIKASLPMRVSGRFVAENTIMGQGALKMIAHAQDRRILGLHAVGPYAPEFIWGGAALIEDEFRTDEVKQLIFTHPTVSELIRDAAWALDK